MQSPALPLAGLFCFLCLRCCRRDPGIPVDGRAASVAAAAGGAEIHQSAAPASPHFGGTKPKSSMISISILS